MRFSKLIESSKPAPAASSEPSPPLVGVAGQNAETCSCLWKSTPPWDIQERDPACPKHGQEPSVVPADAVRDVLQAALDFRGKPDEEDVWGYLEISLRAFDGAR